MISVKQLAKNTALKYIVMNIEDWDNDVKKLNKDIKKLEKEKTNAIMKRDRWIKAKEIRQSLSKK